MQNTFLRKSTSYLSVESSRTRDNATTLGTRSVLVSFYWWFNVLSWVHRLLVWIWNNQQKPKFLLSWLPGTRGGTRCIWSFNSCQGELQLQSWRGILRGGRFDPFVLDFYLGQGLINSLNRPFEAVQKPMLGDSGFQGDPWCPGDPCFLVDACLRGGSLSSWGFLSSWGSLSSWWSLMT